MDDALTATAAAGPPEPRVSSDLKKLSNGISRVEDDPLGDDQPERPYVEVGVETFHEPEPVTPSDEVIKLIPSLLYCDY